MNRTDSYLSLYREVENLINTVWPDSRYESSAFIWLEREISDVGLRKNLRAAREVRNFLTHNDDFRDTDLVVPGEMLFAFLGQLRERLSNVPDAEDLMVPVRAMKKALRTSSVLDAVDWMLETGHRFIPVLEDGRVLSVFSQQDAISYLRRGENEKTFDSIPHECDEALFVSRRDGEKVLAEKLQQVPLLFVTEHGRKTERILGMLTEKDLIRSISRFSLE